METSNGVVEQSYVELPLSDIVLNGFNARKKVKKVDLEDLVASVKEKGVIQPVLVRPVEFEDGRKLELVAGTRRFWASKYAHQQMGTKTPTIPAVVREMSDDDAYEMMLIENIQRRDLSPVEEAQSFADYVKRQGEDGIDQLAARASISPQYIKRRMAILKLPKAVLKAWDEGHLAFRSVEQLLRLSDEDAEEVWTARIEPSIKGGYRVPYHQVEALIQRMMLNLGMARFDVDTTCKGCPQNTAVQLELFGMKAPDKVQCLNLDCFKANQMAHLTKYWKQTKAYREEHTTRPVFSDDYGYGGLEIRSIWKASGECHGCESFVSTVRMDGEVVIDTGCIGDEACYARIYSRAKPGDTDDVPKTEAEKERAAKEKAAKKSANRGMLFREEFFKDALPAAVTEEASDDTRALRLIAFLLQQGHTDQSKHMGHKLGLLSEEERDRVEWYSMGDETFGLLHNLERAELFDLLRDYAVAVLMSKRVSHQIRCEVAKDFGIDLSKEWLITDEYLQKLTKSHLIAMNKRFGWSENEAFTDFISRRYGTPFQELKKSEMIKCVMESGMDLTGMVPDEIVLSE